MAERLFGLETEFALVLTTRGGQPVDCGALITRLMDVAVRRLVHLPGFSGNDLYLANGGRFYIDCGLHPEWATPECTNPWDAVRYQLAGERMLLDLWTEVCRGFPDAADGGVFKNNVDYSGSGATWGAHESYLYTAAPDHLAEQILPHLASRIVFCGAGGFNALSAEGEFLLSPRAPYLDHVQSSSSTHDRGLLHTKDETLAAGHPRYHRLHLLCGESLCSQRANWLRVATTALVVTLIDAGVAPGSAVALRAPVEALRAFAQDPTCQASAPGAGVGRGKRWTALAIQEHYLQCATQHLSAPWMPPWAEQAVTGWRDILERLRAGPAAVDTTLDWAIKHRLFQDRVQRRGLAWQALPAWNQVLGALRHTAREAEVPGPLSAAQVLLPHGPFGPVVRGLAEFMTGHGLAWADLDRVLRLRVELLEIDTRFAQLGERGVFAALDRAGVLEHQIPGAEIPGAGAGAGAGVDDIEHAREHPPALGRARIRGEVVRRLAGTEPAPRCDWMRIYDPATRQILNLGDPWAAEERWEACPPEVLGSEDLVLSGLGQMMWTRLRRPRRSAAP